MGDVFIAVCFSEAGVLYTCVTSRSLYIMHLQKVNTGLLLFEPWVCLSLMPQLELSLAPLPTVNHCYKFLLVVTVFLLLPRFLMNALNSDNLNFFLH